MAGSVLPLRVFEQVVVGLAADVVHESGIIVKREAHALE